MLIQHLPSNICLRCAQSFTSFKAFSCATNLSVQDCVEPLNILTVCNDCMAAL